MSKAQGHIREDVSEGSVLRTYEPMNKNLIEARALVKLPLDSKDPTIKSVNRKSGGCVWKAMEFTS